MRSQITVLLFLAVVNAAPDFLRGTPFHEMWRSNADEHMPVFLLHGINDSAGGMQGLQNFIEKAHPGTKVTNLNDFHDGLSLLSLELQVKQIAESIQKAIARDPETFAEGYHFACHSQGALICRCIIEHMDDHNVHTFISLAGPQAGEYGAYEFLQKLYPKVTVPLLHTILYSSLLQSTLSVANFWHDPNPKHHYLEKNRFLPRYNNEIQHKDFDRFKANLMRVKKIALFGSSSDQEILPWQSSMFGFWDAEQETVSWNDQPMEQSLGLAEMEAAGRLSRTAVDGVEHTKWVRRQDIFNEYLEPLFI